MQNTQDINEPYKIKEAIYLIIIPIIITAACAWIDIWTNINSNAYTQETVIASVEAAINELDTTKESVKINLYSDIGWQSATTSIIRCIMGYFFPSLVSIIIVMIWQQTDQRNTSYGLERSKIFWAVITTLIYSLVFITCLIKYNLITAIILCVTTILYILWYLRWGLDRRIFKNKKDMTQDEILEYHLNK